MDAIDMASGEVKEITRERAGVIWCPFCERSVIMAQATFCGGCHAEFRNPSESDLAQAAPATAPRTRKRASEPVEETAE